jgi:excisionase family DNA binding protein
MKTAKQGVFVRMPQTEAAKLDRAAFELGRTKQDIVTSLVARYLDPGNPNALEPVRIPHVADRDLAVGRHSFRELEPAEVLTLEQLAVLLQLDEEALRAAVEAGEIPARRIGDEWRFSRTAILAWLAAAEAGG